MSCVTSAITITIPSIPDIVITLPGEDIIVTGQPTGPAGPTGQAGIFLPVPAPAPPLSGYLMYCDEADNLLKVVDSFGDIYIVPVV